MTELPTGAQLRAIAERNAESADMQIVLETLRAIINQADKTLKIQHHYFRSRTSELLRAAKAEEKTLATMIHRLKATETGEPVQFHVGDLLV